MEAQEWTLPAISPGSHKLARVELTAQGSLASYVEFDDETLKVSFSGEKGSVQLVEKFWQIDIKLVSSYDDRIVNYT